MDRLQVSERRACLVLGQSRATQRYLPIVRDDEKPLTDPPLPVSCYPFDFAVDLADLAAFQNTLSPP